MRYLDDPYIEERLLIERVQELCKTLASHHTSLLPQRHRSLCARVVVRLTRIRRELERDPQRIADERAQEDQRGETA